MRVSSRATGSEMICLRERQTRFSSSICWPKLRVARRSDYSLMTSVLHVSTRTMKTSKHWQECSCDKLVTNMLLQRNDINPCIYKLFCEALDLEQHGDDFLVCGLTSNSELLADEFKNHFLVKKAEKLVPKDHREFRSGVGICQ